MIKSYIIQIMKKIYKVIGLVLVSCVLVSCGGKKQITEVQPSENADTVKSEILQLEVTKSSEENHTVTRGQISEPENVSAENQEGADTDKNKKSAEKKDKKLRIHAGVLKGPSGIPFAYLMDQYKTINKNTTVEYEQFSQANLVVPKLIKNEINIAVLPPNVAAKIYNSNNGCIKIAAVCGNGMLYLITKDINVYSFNDLKGKEIYVAGSGATPEYLTKYLLSNEGIEEGKGEDKIQLNFSIPNNDLAVAVISGKISYAIVPEPFATAAELKDSNIRRAVNLQSEYFKVNENTENYPMSVIAVNSEFAKENPVYTKKMVSLIEEAILWTQANPIKAAISADTKDLGPDEKIIMKAIPNCSYTFIPAKRARKNLEKLFNIFMENDEASIGGKLPDDSFYLY